MCATYRLRVAAALVLCPGDDAESGRGLLLVEAISTRWGWYATSDGKVVWALCAG